MNVNVGTLIRQERLQKGMSLRELARRIGVSASMLSQVETNRTRPSVSTIYAIANELTLSIDALLSDGQGAGAEAAGRPASSAADLELSIDALLCEGQGAGEATSRGTFAGRRLALPGASTRGANGLLATAAHLVRPAERRRIDLESGVTWELLSDLLPHLVDFMYVTYEPGGRSSSSGKLMRHAGTEFALLLRGELKIQVGFDTYILRAGDALAFDSSEPHLLVNEGTEPAEGVWLVLGRRNSAGS